MPNSDKRVGFIGWLTRRDQVEAARRELEDSTNRLMESAALRAQAAGLAGRLHGHRESNHFAERIETLYKERR